MLFSFNIILPLSTNNEGRLNPLSLIMHASCSHSSYDVRIIGIFCPKKSFVIAKINCQFRRKRDLSIFLFPHDK